MNVNIGQISDALMYRDVELHTQKIYSEGNQSVPPKNSFYTRNTPIKERREIYGHQSGPKLVRGDI